LLGRLFTFWSVTWRGRGIRNGMIYHRSMRHSLLGTVSQIVPTIRKNRPRGKSEEEKNRRKKVKYRPNSRSHSPGMREIRGHLLFFSIKKLSSCSSQFKIIFLLDFTFGNSSGTCPMDPMLHNVEQSDHFESITTC
jgi:hypothetical protein